MLPFYIYYSMFGFQRVGDLIWAAADQRARGFLIGGTSGRTTLGGEGLQHQDGSSHLVATTVPTCRAYDPAFSFELATIVDYGARRMLEEQYDEFFYITVMNENYPQPDIAAGAEHGIVRGMHFLERVVAKNPIGEVRLLGSGAIVPEVIAAGQRLATEWRIESEIWSVTSFSELERDARSVQRWNRLHPEAPKRISYVQECLNGNTPIVAATDYVRGYPQLIASYLDAPYFPLGTDGFGRSDTRKALRRFFEVDRYQIAVAALSALGEQRSVPREMVSKALDRYEIPTDSQPPWDI
jgi:pyruvate dehydrogenase E1 component